MILAITCDFPFEVFMKREGISVFCSFLFDAILKNNPDLKLEFWNYSLNNINVKDVWGFLADKYPDRIYFYNENSYIPSTRDFIITKNIKYNNNLRKKLLHLSLYKLTHLKTFKNKYKKYAKRFAKDIHPNSNERLIQAVQKMSQADAVYIISYALKLGKHFKCKKFVSVHDLMTIMLEDCFKESVLNVEEINQDVIENLNEYALLDTKFISSSNYVAKEHTRKYIKNVKDEQLCVIPYPPMIKTYENIEQLPSKKQFTQKHNIKGKYIAYATQIRPNKNTIVLLKALKNLIDNNINLKLVTTGRFSHTPSTSKYIKNNKLENQIIETGDLSEEELYCLYKYSDMVVVPTIVEGPGLAQQAIEALMVGNIPVICSKSFGVEENLSVRGLSMETADLNWFNYDDHEYLTKLIISVLNDPQSHINKQKHIIKNYTALSWDDVAKNYIKTFSNELIKAEPCDK